MSVVYVNVKMLIHIRLILYKKIKCFFLKQRILNVCKTCMIIINTLLKVPLFVSKMF